MAYTQEKPPLTESTEQLRARIPGWGADLDPADRPAVPRERFDLDTGAHWDFPDRQEELAPRERSIEHEQQPVCRASFAVALVRVGAHHA